MTFRIYFYPILALVLFYSIFCSPSVLRVHYVRVYSTESYLPMFITVNTSDGRFLEDMLEEGEYKPNHCYKLQVTTSLISNNYIFNKKEIKCEDYCYHIKQD